MFFLKFNELSFVLKEYFNYFETTYIILRYPNK